MPDNTNTTTVRSGGIGFAGLLAILFIGLKLTGFIAWSWLWVLSPLWVPLAVVLGILLAMGLFALLMLAIGGAIDASQKAKRKRALNDKFAAAGIKAKVD